jgi:uncharacterized protein (DUF58 family)
MVSADEARQLDRLAFGTDGSVRPGASGARVARSRGFGSEFHEFRHYQPGDDARALEWTISARLGQLIVRTSRADAVLRVHLLVDVSASMTTGTPSKLACAKQLAALLAYVAAGGRDAVGLTTFDNHLQLSMPPGAGRHQLHRVVEALAAAPAGGASSVTRALMEFGEAHRGPGLCVILSDFFDPAGSWEGLRYLLHRGVTPAIVQIVSDDELNPSLDGEVELFDIEDPQARSVVAGPDAVALYRSRLENLTAGLREFSVSHGCPWSRVSASASFGDLVQACQQAGLLTVRA